MCYREQTTHIERVRGGGGGGSDMLGLGIVCGCIVPIDFDRVDMRTFRVR